METIAELIDKLVTYNLKVWHYIENDDQESYLKMKAADLERHNIMQELDERLAQLPREVKVKVHKGLKTWK
jgi:hypothetical protein